MEDTLMKNIEEYIKEENYGLEFGDGENSFVIKVHDYVEFDSLAQAIEEIAAIVRLNQFDYELFDFQLAYFVIKLFTDIPIPMTTDDDGEEIPEYAKCYDICTRMNLINEICAQSDRITEYIELIEKNVWRRLEYYKAIEANSALMMVCDKAYDIFDGIDKMLAKTENVDLNAIAEELSDVTSKLSLVENEEK